jgi:HEAT repeat protein
MTQQRIAVSVLGYLGNKGAAPPLVKLAKQSQKTDDTRSRIGTLRPLLDWDVRVDALVAAGRLGDPRTIPDLIELTAHREGAMREAATFALGMTGDRRAALPLLEALDDPLPSVRTLGCLGLSRVADRKALPRIIDVVRDSKHDDTTRAACAFALGATVEKTAVPALAETLAEGNDEVQRVAAWALGRIASNKALPALLGSYFSKRDRIREAVAWALPRVIAGKPATDDVVSYMDYPMRLTKFDPKTAVRSLGGPLEAPPLTPSLIIGHEKELADGLREALQRHRDLVVRVLIDLDERDGSISLGPLTARLAEAEPAQRDAVTAAADRIGAAILPELEKLTEHRDPVVRQRALLVMAKVGSPAVAAMLQNALEDDRRTVREAAMLAAASYVRRHGASARPLVEAVSARLTATRWQERKAAAEALGRFGAMGDVDALTRAVAQDATAFVRQAAAASLGQLANRAAVPALLRAVAVSTEPNPAVRLAAVRALVAIGDPRAKDALAAVARTDPDPKVQDAAKRFR